MNAPVPPPLPPRAPLPSSPDTGSAKNDLWRQAMTDLSTHTAALAAPIQRLDKSTTQLRPWIVRSLIGQAIQVVCTIAMVIAVFYIVDKFSDVSARTDELSALLRKVSEESATKQQVQDVKSQVTEVQASQPQVEIRTVDAGAGRPAKATGILVVRPKSSATATPAVEIPVTLPPGSRVSDAGAP